MAHRGNESPMDFQWQGHGPSDPSSPFHKIAMDNAKKRRKLTAPKSIFSSLTPSQGTHSAFSSPSKNSFMSLDNPNGKPYFFNATPKQTPQYYQDSPFTSPRKPIDIDFSSGPESSPVQPPEELTPDGKPLPPLPRDFKASPKASEKRNSLFNFYGRYAPSPNATSGRGEIKKPHSDALAKRIYKKRRQGQNFERQLALSRVSTSEETDSDSDEPYTKTQIKNKPRRSKKAEEVGWLTGIFTFIHTYPDAPSIIAKYLQVFFNAIILSGCLYMLYSFYATIRADVDRASQDAMSELIVEMTGCKQQFVENGCASPTRVPYLDNICNQWAECMNKDPAVVNRARLSAHTFAEIFNSFVEPISLKTMVFSILVVGIALFINNATFTIYRRSQEHHNDAHRYASGQYPPPAPYAAQIGQFAMTPGYPYGGQQPGFWTPGIPGQSQGQLDFDQSPSKDRGRSRSPEKKRLALEN